MLEYVKAFYLSVRNASSGILAVCFTTLFVAISSTATFAITPFFLKDTLGLGFITIGLIEAGTEAVSQVARLVSGIISDRLKRCKPMFLLGTVFAFIAKPLMIFAVGSVSVLVSKVFDRLGNGLSATPRDAYVALHSPPNTKGANIGLTMTFKTVGCVVGPFLVMACVSLFTKVNWRLLLCFTAIPAMLSVFICQKYMIEKRHSEVSFRKNSFSFADIYELSPKFWSFLFIMFAFMLARAPESYLVLNLRDSGVPEWFCAGAIGFFNLISVLISYPAGQLSDKYSRINVLMVSFLALLISVLCFTTQSSFWCVIGVVFWGIQRSSSQIISVSYISDLVKKNIIGTAIGLLNIVSAISGVIAVYVMGLISKEYSIASAYFSSVAFSVIALLMLFAFKLKFRDRTA